MYNMSVRQVTCRIYSLLHSVRRTALLAGVSKSSVARWICSPDRKPYPSRKDGSKSQLISEMVRSAILCSPLASVQQLRARIQQALSVSVSHQLVRTVLRALGFTSKKARFCGRPANLQTKVDNFLAERDAFLAQGRHFVSVDETSFGRNSFQHVRGYAPRGQPLYVSKRRPRTTTASVVACTSASGLVALQERTNKSFDTASFITFLKSLSLPRETVLLLDNVRFHHSRAVRELAAEKGLCLLYVPPYSPWFNPIEYCFSVVKRAYRRTEDIAKAFDALTTDHCRAFFRKSLSATGPPGPVADVIWGA